MTHREAYVLGWVWGRLLTVLGSSFDPTGEKYLRGAVHPFAAFADANSTAVCCGKMTDELRKEITEALSEVRITSDSPRPLTLKLQGCWQLGVYHAMGGFPLADYKKPTKEAEKYDLKAHRVAKGITQEQLAKAIGVSRPNIARWESGDVTPSTLSLKKLKEILD